MCERVCVLLRLRGASVSWGAQKGLLLLGSPKLLPPPGGHRGEDTGSREATGTFLTPGEAKGEDGGEGG